jgi:hypothetical protein
MEPNRRDGIAWRGGKRVAASSSAGENLTEMVTSGIGPHRSAWGGRPITIGIGAHPYALTKLAPSTSSRNTKTNANANKNIPRYTKASLEGKASNAGGDGITANEGTGNACQMATVGQKGKQSEVEEHKTQKLIGNGLGRFPFSFFPP